MLIFVFILFAERKWRNIYVFYWGTGENMLGDFKICTTLLVLIYSYVFQSVNANYIYLLSLLLGTLDVIWCYNLFRRLRNVAWPSRCGSTRRWSSRTTSSTSSPAARLASRTRTTRPATSPSSSLGTARRSSRSSTAESIC